MLTSTERQTIKEVLTATVIHAGVMYIFRNQGDDFAKVAEELAISADKLRHLLANDAVHKKYKK